MKRPEIASDADTDTMEPEVAIGPKRRKLRQEEAPPIYETAVRSSTSTCATGSLTAGSIISESRASSSASLLREPDESSTATGTCNAASEGVREAPSRPSGIALRGGRVRLPDKLMEYLNKKVVPEVLYWEKGGKTFSIDGKRAQTELLDKYFGATKLTSFTRSLNRWGFRRIFHALAPKNVLNYEHPMFLQDNPELVKQMRMADPNLNDHHSPATLPTQNNAVKVGTSPARKPADAGGQAAGSLVLPTTSIQAPLASSPLALNSGTVGSSPLSPTAATATTIRSLLSPPPVTANAVAQAQAQLPTQPTPTPPPTNNLQLALNAIFTNQGSTLLDVLRQQRPADSTTPPPSTIGTMLSQLSSNTTTTSTPTPTTTGTGSNQGLGDVLQLLQHYPQGLPQQTQQLIPSLSDLVPQHLAPQAPTQALQQQQQQQTQNQIKAQIEALVQIQQLTQPPPPPPTPTLHQALAQAGAGGSGSLVQALQQALQTAVLHEQQKQAAIQLLMRILNQHTNPAAGSSL